MFVDAGYPDFPDKMSYSDFKESWYAFLDLLDLNYCSSFSCPQCGPAPETVVIDATSVAFRKELLSWKNIFSTDRNHTELYDKVDPGR